MYEISRSSTLSLSSVTAFSVSPSFCWEFFGLYPLLQCKNAANLAYDRTLLASARTVAERLQVVDGHLSVNVPYVVLDSFELNNDRIFYQVISPDGETISGYDDLPPIPLLDAFTALYCASLFL